MTGGTHVIHFTVGSDLISIRVTLSETKEDYAKEGECPSSPNEHVWLFFATWTCQIFFGRNNDDADTRDHCQGVCLVRITPILVLILQPTFFYVFNLKKREHLPSYTNESLNKRFFFLITSTGGQIQRTLNSVRGEKKETVQDVIDLPARSSILGHGIRKDQCIDSFFSGQLIAA